MDAKLRSVDIGYRLYLVDDGNSCGTVRQVAPGNRDELIVYVLNEGTFIVPVQAVRSVHDAKVIVDPAELDDRVREAMLRAHGE